MIRTTRLFTLPMRSMLIRPLSTAPIRGTSFLPASTLALSRPYPSATATLKNHHMHQHLPLHQHRQYHNQSQPSATDDSSPPQPLLLLIAGYLVLVNAGAVALFWYDKNQAQKKGWRVPEKQLQLTALLGGWIGGMWAMKQFKHKTVKKEFQQPYYVAVAGNMVIMGGLAGAWMFLPRFRQSAKSFVRGIVG